MASAEKKFYSKEDITLALDGLRGLPDLSEEKLTKNDVLESLKDEIIILATKKSYSAAEIKSALLTVDINVSEKAINDILKASESKTKRSRKKSDKNKEQ